MNTLSSLTEEHTYTQIIYYVFIAYLNSLWLLISVYNYTLLNDSPHYN